MRVIDGDASVHKADMAAVVIQAGLRDHGRSDWPVLCSHEDILIN